jgi:hypothetical protein
MLAAMLASAQPKRSPKSVVFKVRAPASSCAVFPEDSVFWIEKENKVRIKARTRNPVKVVFRGGTIISSDGENYIIRFDSTGSTVLSVYEMEGWQKRLIYTKSYKVREPDIFFCGVKAGTRGKALQLRDEHFKAYSIPLDTTLRVVSFDMMFHNGLKYKTYHSDTSMLSNEMRKVIFEDFRFPADGNKQLFFSNINVRMPDGKVKTLTPITLLVERDSTNRDEVVFNFSVRRMRSSGKP